MQNVFHWVGLRNLPGVFCKRLRLQPWFPSGNGTTHGRVLGLGPSIPIIENNGRVCSTHAWCPNASATTSQPANCAPWCHIMCGISRRCQNIGWLVSWGCRSKKGRNARPPTSFATHQLGNCKLNRWPACVPFRDFAAILRSALPGISLQPREVWTTGRNPSAPGSRNSRFPKLCPSERAARLPCNGVARCKLQVWASLHVRGRAAQSATIPAGLVDQSPAWGRGRGTVSSFRLCTPASLWPNIALPSGLSFPQTETCEASSARRAKRTAGMLSGLL